MINIKKCIGIFIKNETSSLQLLSVKSTKIVANLLLVIFLKALDSYKLVNYRYCRDWDHWNSLNVTIYVQHAMQVASNQILIHKNFSENKYMHDVVIIRIEIIIIVIIIIIIDEVINCTSIMFNRFSKRYIIKASI